MRPEDHPVAKESSSWTTGSDLDPLEHVEAILSSSLNESTSSSDYEDEELEEIIEELFASSLKCIKEMIKSLDPTIHSHKKSCLMFMFCSLKLIQLRMIVRENSEDNFEVVAKAFSNFLKEATEMLENCDGSDRIPVFGLAICVFMVANIAMVVMLKVISMDN